MGDDLWGASQYPEKFSKLLLGQDAYSRGMGRSVGRRG